MKSKMNEPVSNVSSRRSRSAIAKSHAADGPMKMLRNMSGNHWYLRDHFTQYSLIAILVIVVGSLIWGFLLDWHGFLEGVLSSIAFSGITIVVGLFFVDRLIEHRQEQQWAKVRLLTYRGLAA